MLVSKISRGTVMDQIYIPKERVPGLEVGTAVLVEPVAEMAVSKQKLKPYYYNVSGLEPVKVMIIEEIFRYLESSDNVIIAGSFLEPGFHFEDIDVIVVTAKFRGVDARSISRHFLAALGIKVQIVAISFKVLLKGISTDPLFEMLVSRFVSKKRVIFRTKREMHFKLLDLHLLKSKMLSDNFEFLSGREKYKLTRNMIAVSLFLTGKKLSTAAVNGEIERQFGKDSIELIKENKAGRDFLIKYKSLYNCLFEKIMAGIKNDPKQKQAS